MAIDIIVDQGSFRAVDRSSFTTYYDVACQDISVQVDSQEHDFQSFVPLMGDFDVILLGCRFEVTSGFPVSFLQAILAGALEVLEGRSCSHTLAIPDYEHFVEISSSGGLRNMSISIVFRGENLRKSEIELQEITSDLEKIKHTLDQTTQAYRNLVRKSEGQ